jgi:hypothetical protein
MTGLAPKEGETMAPRSDEDVDDDLERALSTFEDDGESDEWEGDEEAVDDEVIVRRVEAVFRAERQRIRECGSVGDLRTMRTEHESTLAIPGLHLAAVLRCRDLLELVDDRITDIKARQLVHGRA